jgi:hypothetical protein
VVRAAEPERGEQLVRLGDEVAIGEIEQLHRPIEFLLAQEQRVHRRFYVSHVDIYERRC